MKDGQTYMLLTPMVALNSGYNMCNCKKSENIPVVQQIKTVANLPIQQVVKGVIGKAEVAMGMNLASQETIRKRIDICRDCPESTKNPDPQFIPNNGLTSKSRCLKCTCSILKKTSWKDSVCPLEKWHKED